jgi:hypothetical protein
MCVSSPCTPTCWSRAWRVRSSSSTLEEGRAVTKERIRARHGDGGPVRQRRESCPFTAMRNIERPAAPSMWANIVAHSMFQVGLHEEISWALFYRFTFYAICRLVPFFFHLPFSLGLHETDFQNSFLSAIVDLKSVNCLVTNCHAKCSDD